MKRKTKTIPIGKLRPGPIRHTEFSEGLLQRMRRVHTRIKDVYSATLEKWELAFMRDTYPEKELAIWEAIADATDAAFKQFPNLGRKAIFNVVLSHSLSALKPAQLADPNVKRIVRICERK